MGVVFVMQSENWKGNGRWEFRGSPTTGECLLRVVCCCIVS